MKIYLQVGESTESFSELSTTWCSDRIDESDVEYVIASKEPNNAPTGDRACPCLYGEPCNKMCTCVKPFSSRGCENCCTYGGEDQRKKKAEYLKRHLPKESVSDSEIKEESIKQYHSLCLDFDSGSAITDRVAFQKGAKWLRDRLSTKELGKKECKHDIKLVSGGSFQDRFECQKEGCDYHHH